MASSLPFRLDDSKVTVAPGTSYVKRPVKAHDYAAGVMAAFGSVVEHLGTSLLALGRGELFPLLNYETADAECPIRPARSGDPSGDLFVSAAITPQGQSGALVIRGWR